jgi:hypothetical protein
VVLTYFQTANTNKNMITTKTTDFFAITILL